MRRYPWLTALAASACLVGCGSGIDVPPATTAVTQQQIHLYAIAGTPVGTPSAYDMVQLGEVQIFRSNSWDYVFDLGPDSSYGLGTTGDTIAVILPRGYFGFAEDGGVIWTLSSFDSVLVAPIIGYEQKKATRVRAGDTFLVSSRAQACNFGVSRPLYAKGLIQSIDLVTRSAVILMEVDTNCGFIGLGIGIPTH
ncbi:MAG TPA: hypothetical protein VGI92_01775 [Gemmatimonadales bacterium]|jgi:hypothetical protein